MINFEKAQWADNIIVVLKDGERHQGHGAGILLAKDYDENEYQFDTFYINDGTNSITFEINEIEDIIIIE